MKHVNINASQTEQVTSDMLDTLALLCGMSLDETSDLVGSLISEFGFHDTKAKLMARFPHLALQIDTLWVRFADDEVRKVLGKNVKGDENANFTVEELAKVKSLNAWFVSNTKIETFEELSLTGITTWGNTVRFDGCENLKAIDVSKLTDSNAGGYTGKTKIKVFNFTSMRNLVSSYFNPIVGGDYVRAVFLPVVETISPYPGTHDNGWDIVLITNTKNVLIADLGAKAKFVRESVNWFSNCPNAYGIYRGVGNNIAKGANEKIFTPIKDEANGFFTIGGSKWQEVMQQLAKEEGKTFDDYSLRYIDYDIYGVDYATDELNALTLSIPDEYLGKDGETFVFDTAPLVIGYDPEPTRKEYFTLSKPGSDEVSVADTEGRFIKMLTMDATNAGSLHDVTFTAVSTQVEGVKAVRTFKCAYPLISAVNLSFGNQFVSAAFESNTDNARYTQMEYSADGGIGVSDNGWVYANAHGEAASGTVTVRSKTTPSSVSSIEVAVTADAVQRQRFADAEVERVIVSKKVGNKGNVIGEDDFRELTDIAEWFKGNTAITLFPELADTNVRVLKNDAFNGCASLTKLDTHNIEIFGAKCLNETRMSEIDLSSCKVAYRYAFGSYLARNTVKKLIISSMEQYEDISVGETDGSVWGINNQAPRQPDCELYIGDAKWNGAYVATRDTLRHSLFLNCPCLYHADLRSVKIMNEWSMAFCSNLIDVYLPEEPFERKGRREVLSGNKNTIYYVPSEESKKKWTGDTSWNWDTVLPEDNFKVIGQ